jgi:hypothetical protein
MEADRDGDIPFPDTDVHRRPDNGSFGYREYRKPTHTNLYLNAKYHHHPANKLAVLSTLAYRDKAICDSESLPHKLIFLHNTFLNNGYSKK